MKTCAPLPLLLGSDVLDFQCRVIYGHLTAHHLCFFDNLELQEASVMRVGKCTSL